jgi:hypothetical protein
MKSPKKNGIGEVVTEYGARVMKVIKKGLLGRSLFDFYGDIKAQTFKTKEMDSVPSTPADGKGGVIYTKSSDGKLYYKSNEVAEVELSADDTATNIVVTDNASTDEDNAIVFVADADIDGSTSAALESDGANLLYNPSSGKLKANSLDAAISLEIGNDVAVTGISAGFHGAMNLLEDSNNASGPIFTLIKTRGGSIAAQDNDEVGEIRFQSIDDKSPTPDTIIYSRLITSILDASDGNECGKLDISVANDGSNQTGISMTGNVSTADQIDITIGNLPTSETTINGNVTIQNTANDDVAPTLKIYNNRTNDGVDDQSTGIILFAGKDDGTPSEKTFGKIECIATDTQAGSEDSKILLYSMVSGVLVNRLTLAEFGAESSLTSDLKVVGYVKSSVGPSTTPRFCLNYQDSAVAADEIIGDVTWSNEDDDGHTLRIQGVATEAHASGSAGGSKLEFYTTPNTTSALALAATIDQDKSLTVEGNARCDNLLAERVVQSGNASITPSNDGVAIHVDAADITDTGTSASSTTNAFYHVSFENPRLLATNSSVTTTYAATVHIKGAPIASTNQTITNAYALYVAGGTSYFGGAITANGGVTGDLTGNAATATALTSGDKTISGNLTVTSGDSGDATLTISADTDNNDENDSPRLWFKADGDIIEGAIQHKDNTFDFISNVSANGGFRFLTGTTNNTGTTDPETGATEKMRIDPAGLVTITHTAADSGNGLLIVRSDTSTTTDDLLGAIGFDSTDGNVPSSTLEGSAYIAAYASEAHSTGDKGGYLTFGVSPINQNDDTVSTEALRVTELLTTVTGDLRVSGNQIEDDDGTTCITFDSSGNTSIGGTLSCADLDITGTSNALTVNPQTGNVAINCISTDADCMIRVQDNSTAGTNVIGLVATGDDSIIRNDEGNFKVKMANNATTTLDLDQNGNLDITGNILPGITEVKILPRDFIPDDAGRPAMMDDTGSDRWLESHGTSKLYANVEIPLGFKATHVHIYGSATSAITVYEADVNSKTVTSKGTGNIGTNLNITDVTADATNYILIELAQASGEEVYGGIMTIAKV